MEFDKATTDKKRMKRILLVISVMILTVGHCGGPLMRLYFLHGGKRIWLSSWLETAGWPLNFIPLLVTYFQRQRKAGADRSSRGHVRVVLMNRRIFFSAAVIGILTGVDDYLYAFGVAKLPISTASLIIASQLAFTALFAFLLVRQKFTAYSINAVFLLTLGAGVLALHTSSDRPPGESRKEYYLGFIMTIAAAVLYGFVLPLVELMYKKARQTITYTLVLEIQLVMCFFATLFCTIGMIINNDFKVIPREAREFGLGEEKYYMILVCSAIIWQCFYLGANGVIFTASSLFSAIIIAVLLPVTEVFAVIFYKEKFQAEKGVSLVLSLWGFVSYTYGEIKHSKDVKKEEGNSEELLPTNITPP